MSGESQSRRSVGSEFQSLFAEEQKIPVAIYKFTYIQRCHVM